MGDMNKIEIYIANEICLRVWSGLNDARSVQNVVTDLIKGDVSIAPKARTITAWGNAPGMFVKSLIRAEGPNHKSSLQTESVPLERAFSP